MTTLKRTIGGTLTASPLAVYLADMCILCVKSVTLMAMCLVTQLAHATALYIDLGCNGFKMLRIDAGTHPAQMINLHSGWDWSYESFVCPSVCSDGECFGGSELSVSVFSTTTGRGDTPRPKPATGVWFRRNKFPESFECSRIASRHVISLGSMCLGLREAGNFVAARSYFTPVFNQ